MPDLRRPLRRLLNRSVHAAWRWAEHVGDVAPGTDLGDRFGTFGPGACLAFPLSDVVNPAAIHIGRDTLIGKYATLSVGYGPTQAVLPERGLVIGERCVLGARVCITAHESIEIGDDVWFGQDVFVSDASHGYTDPDVPVGRQFGAHQPVAVGAGSWIGHGAMILPGTTIGRNVVVAAGSVVRGDVPDHSVVGGVPAKLIRRLEPGAGWVRVREEAAPTLTA
ncbi:acyltransferase [Pimelobacter simplex]|uniref:Chloramphenicol acetyltransferase n=2 Tax=Nocardioides simplex TaxID=2045 RepID=A0A0A1DPU7_NOCSI|nr:acyltransferase [Pimelobacter simplex]AIY17415.1 Chloramphenicol acetyltransferase [Pimelobacter simplex]SFM64867.1 Hexapeptide repeat of succinyl-transferase [Pimelobacter simplex]